MYTPTFPRVTIRLESLNLAHGKPKLLDCQAQSVELDGRITFYLDLTNSKLKQNHFSYGFLSSIMLCFSNRNAMALSIRSSSVPSVFFNHLKSKRQDSFLSQQSVELYISSPVMPVDFNDPVLHTLKRTIQNIEFTVNDHAQ